MASIIERIRRRLVTDYHKKRYMQVASQVLQTPALRPGDSPFMALSMVQQRFVSDVSHELRTPLNLIIGYCEMLLEDARDLGHDDEIEPLERILRAGRPALLDVVVTPEAASSDAKSGLAWVPDLQALGAWDDAERRWRHA